MTGKIVSPHLSAIDGLPLQSDARYAHRNDPDNGFAFCQKLKIRVLLDGEDITRDCFFFDRELGLTGLYKRNEDGQRYAVRLPDGDHGIAQEWKQGQITLVEPER